MLDGDGIGDVCDRLVGHFDTDGDGVPDPRDNCVDIPNPGQRALDCGPNSDFDRDGVVLSLDNCPLVFNADQADADMNAQGDACDNDRDGDEYIDGTPVNGMPMFPPDNCPGVANADQSDADFDGNGDACVVPVQ